jgi:hypothetical protein
MVLVLVVVVVLLLILLLLHTWRLVRQAINRLYLAIGQAGY